MAGRYQTYPEYKDSGVEWIGDIPAHWNSTRLKFSSGINMGQSPASEDCNQRKVGLPFLQGNAEFGEKYPFPEKYCATPRKVAHVGELLFSVRAPVGALNIADQKYGIGRGLCSLCVSKKLSNRFLWWLIPVVNSELFAVSTGSTFEAVSAEQVKNVFCSYPEIDEQKVITNFLDHETAQIDNLIEKQELLITLLKEKRQAVVSHAVTKGLNPNILVRDSGVEWLGEVPEHWTCKSYRYAALIYRGKFGHRPRNDPAFYDGEYPFIQTGDIAQAGKEITRYKQTLNERGKSVSQRFPAGTLVMAIAANIGDTAILGFEAYAPDSVVGFKPTNSTNLEFLRYSLMAALPALEQTSTQSTQANLNIDRIGAVQTILPPINEQEQIVSHLDTLLRRYGKIEGKVASAISLLKERRTALISAAVTGKIDVRNFKVEKCHAT